MKIKRLIILIIITILLSNNISYANQTIRLDNNDHTIVLVTGFGPFLNFEINPSELIAEELNGTKIENIDIIGIDVPVNLSNFTESIEIVCQAINKYNPDYIFSIGLAAGEERIRIEKIGYNLKVETDSSLEKIIPDGRWIRFSSLPALKIVRELKKESIPADISLFGGLSLCNGLLYSLRHYIDVNNLKIKSGFIHVPMHKTEEKPDKMKLETMINATKTTIKVTHDFYSW